MQSILSISIRSWIGKVSLRRVRSTGIQDQTVAVSMSNCLRKDSEKLIENKFSVFRDKLSAFHFSLTPCFCSLAECSVILDLANLGK